MELPLCGSLLKPYLKYGVQFWPLPTNTGVQLLETIQWWFTSHCWVQCDAREVTQVTESISAWRETTKGELMQRSVFKHLKMLIMIFLLEFRSNRKLRIMEGGNIGQTVEAFFILFTKRVIRHWDKIISDVLSPKVINFLKKENILLTTFHFIVFYLFICLFIYLFSFFVLREWIRWFCMGV